MAKEAHQQPQTVGEEAKRRLLCPRCLIQSSASSSIAKPTKVSSMFINQRTRPLFRNGKHSQRLTLRRFKRLSIEERVNALSTVCPHLVEIFTTMYQRGEQTGKEGSSFARIAHSLGPQYQEHQYFNPSSPYHRHAYQAFPHHFYPSSEYQSNQGSPCFDDLFYHRPASSSET